MATLKDIKGTNVQSIAGDPSNPIEGQIWYNSSARVLKGETATSAGAWSTGGALNTARTNLAGSNSAGTQTAALAFGGNGGTTATEQ